MPPIVLAPIQTTTAGAASVVTGETGFADKLLPFLIEFNKLISNPIIQARFMPKPTEGQAFPAAPQPVAIRGTGAGLGGSPATAHATPLTAAPSAEELTKTPEGRKQIVKMLSDIRRQYGDLRLSELEAAVVSMG